jgi:peptidoglycan/xylan/chitin deacetylase (PgdA/CDA1 family)
VRFCRAVALSSTLILLAVGYHYVSAEPPPKPRAIFPVSVGALRAQLELLARSWQFVSRDELVAAAAGETTLPERACAVTFDDGLRCQVDLALPVLEELGVPAIFFVPGQPLAEGRVLHVHKVHALRERVDDAELLELVGADEVPEDVAVEHYRYDTPQAARVKYLLNMALPADERDRVVGAAFAELFPDEAAFAAELYMSHDQVRALASSVGAHSYAHEPLALLPPDELDRDLERVTTLLEEIAGARPRVFSYPHGTPTTVDLGTARRVGAAGYRIAFTMERALNRSLDEPLLLARLDANDAPGGKRPLTEIPPARSRYFEEAVPA